MSFFSGYDEIEHTADWEIHVKGRSIGEFFANCAFAMQALTGIQMDHSQTEKFIFNLEAKDLEGLLVRFLEEVHFIIETRGMFIQDINISISNHTLHCTGNLAPIIHIEKEIKAVTWHHLEILESEQGFSSNIVFDV